MKFRTAGFSAAARIRAVPKDSRRGWVAARGGPVARPPAPLPEFQTAPPTKRANPDGTPVRLFDGTLVAHANEELANRLLRVGAAEACRSGPRRYLRLRQGISIPCTERGWDIIEFLRMWHGDKRAAGYVAHKDRQSERLLFQPPCPAPERLRSVPRLARRRDAKASEQVSEAARPHVRGAK